MEKRDLELIEKLMVHNEELRQLMQEHQELERQLEKYTSRNYLSPEEEMEKKRIQKLKLAGKDRIEEILSTYRDSAQAETEGH
jgi:hypothetical protein